MLRRGKLAVESSQGHLCRMTTADDLLTMKPDKAVSAREFGVASDMKIPAFSKKTEYVPEIDTAYRFDPQTTLAILAG
jgi:cobaltochelatase CobS